MIKIIGPKTQKKTNLLLHLIFVTETHKFEQQQKKMWKKCKRKHKKHVSKSRRGASERIKRTGEMYTLTNLALLLHAAFFIFRRSLPKMSLVHARTSFQCRFETMKKRRQENWKRMLATDKRNEWKCKRRRRRRWRQQTTGKIEQNEQYARRQNDVSKRNHIKVRNANLCGFDWAMQAIAQCDFHAGKWESI